MIHHENEFSSLRLFDQTADLFGGLRQRLLHKNVLSCFERGQREVKMSVHRCRNGNGIDPAVFQQVLKFFRCRDAGMTALAKRQLRRVHVANCNDLRSLSGSEIAHEVRPPIAVPDHSNAYQSVPHPTPTMVVRLSRSSRHILPDPTSIYDIQMPSFRQRHHLELIMVDQDNCDLATSHRFIDIHQFCSVLRKTRTEAYEDLARRS